MTFKSGEYTGEKYSDGSMRIWKSGILVGEFYVSVSANNKGWFFGQNNFKNLCKAIEENCHPCKGGMDE